jgi:hypothetical protein
VLAKEGSNEQLLERLRTENLHTLDLFAIRWRLQDREFFTAVSEILRQRLHFSETVSSFGFLHNDVESLRGYLENSQAVHQLGQWLDSPLLEIRPRVHHDWETLDFDPLVNPRAHRFGSESRLTHEAAREHYHAFLDQLRWKAALDSSDHLTLAAFLFLQDRIDEALARFGKIDPVTLPGRIHYDYLHAVALFYQSNPTKPAPSPLTTRSPSRPAHGRIDFRRSSTKPRKSPQRLCPWRTPTPRTKPPRPIWHSPLRQTAACSSNTRRWMPRASSCSASISRCCFPRTPSSKAPVQRQL